MYRAIFVFNSMSLLHKMIIFASANGFDYRLLDAFCRFD